MLRPESRVRSKCFVERPRRPPVAMLLSLVFLLSLAAGGRAATRVSSTGDGGPIYQRPGASGLIALTVNVDWGQEYIPLILDACESYGVSLTFFVTGRWAEGFPGLVEEMASRGHEIGNHGYAHPHPDHLSVEENIRDIRRAEEVIRGITGMRPRLYAPPYGERGKAVLEAARRMGYITILWSSDSLDWKYRDPRGIVERVLRKAGQGGIVLLHPTDATAAALPSLIEELRRSGLEPVTVSRLLAATD